MQAADLQNAIAANDNTKRLTDVPKYYGNTKDTLTAREFVKRLEQAAAIGNWNDKQKCAEFCHLIHSEAKGFMTMTLKKAKIAEEDWAGHKRVFLKFYDIFFIIILFSIFVIFNNFHKQHKCNNRLTNNSINNCSFCFLFTPFFLKVFRA